MKLTKILSIMALFLSLSISESYAIISSAKAWRRCALAASTTGLMTWYCAGKTKESYKKARNWNLEEERQKQRTKEENAHSMLEKFRAYHDSFFVNRLGQLRDYSESASWATTTIVSGLATAIFVAAPFALSDKQLKRH